MRPDIDPDLLAPHERLREVAAILAAGLLRLRDRAAIGGERGEHPAPKKVEETGDSCLEVSDETVLSVDTG